MTTTYELIEAVGYRINDLPEEKSVYERLESQGTASLSIQDLLSVALGQPEQALAYVQEYGLYALTTLHSVDEMVTTLGVTSKEASYLLTALELGKRLYARGQGSLVYLRGISDVYDHYRSMASLPKEQLRALLINSRYQLVHDELLAVGTIESLEIHPRDVFQAAVERRVNAIILVHNHPSGDPTPSAADLEFTQKMALAGNLLGIQILDHVIIADSGCSSCLKK